MGSAISKWEAGGKRVGSGLKVGGKRSQSGKGLRSGLKVGGKRSQSRKGVGSGLKVGGKRPQSRKGVGSGLKVGREAISKWAGSDLKAGSGWEAESREYIEEYLCTHISRVDCLYIGLLYTLCSDPPQSHNPAGIWI